MKIFKCERCGNEALIMGPHLPMMLCCGEIMYFMEPNANISQIEAHKIIATRVGGKIIVKVGIPEHEMINEHYIETIMYETSNKRYKRIVSLKPGEILEASFDDAGPGLITACCNLHGMFVIEYK